MTGNLRLAARLAMLGGLCLHTPHAAAQTEPAAQIEPGSAQATATVKITRVAELVTEPDAPRPDLIPASHFAGRSAFRMFRMSPDGTRLAIVREVEGRRDIVLLDAATREPVAQFSLPESQSLDWLRWAGNDKLLMSISYPTTIFDVPLRVNRLLVRDLSINASFELELGKSVIWGGELVHLAEDGSHALIAVQDSWRDYPSVYRYELRPDGAVEKVVKSKAGAWSWYADDAGIVRLGMGWNNRRLKVWYRKDTGGEFELVGKLKADDEKSRYWSVVQIVSGSDKGYVLEEGENGRVGVRLFDYSTGQPLETFYEHPDWDVDELWLKDDGTPLAALYTDDRDRITWFDAGRARLNENLAKAMQLDEVRITARSRDDERMLIWGGSEADPGALYIFTPDARTLDLLANYRPGLDFRQLVKPQPVRYRARDGLGITAYLTVPRGRPARGLPLIIMPHGGPFGVRDKLAYNDEVQLLANRGYAVLQPNFRGSGGYGDAFYEAGTGQVGRGMQDDIDDAMDWAVSEGIADPARVCVVGGSYGGYAALWAVLRNPGRYACAASWAGVTDWDKMLAYDKRYLTSKAGKTWKTQVQGDDAFDLDAVSPYRLAAQLSRPVLLAHGTADDNVPFKQYELMVRAARQAPVPLTTLVVEGEGHSFSSIKSEQQWYDAMDTFLATHNPADQRAPDGTFTPPRDPAKDEGAVASTLRDGAGAK